MSKRSSPSKKSAPSQRPKANPDVGDHLRVARSKYRDVGALQDFAGSGREPLITDVEALVVFADLRGFTKYVHTLQQVHQDNKVHAFLKNYFRIYPEAVLAGISEAREKPGLIAGNNLTEACRLLVPSSYKNLGDGMMIVWELQSASTPLVMANVTRLVYLILRKIELAFYRMTRNLSIPELDAYSNAVSEMKMGFGMAKGHAWRLDFGRGAALDYAGSIINTAARLQDLARPEGIAALVSSSEAMFRDFAESGNGRIVELTTLKGLEAQKFAVWLSQQIASDQPPISLTVRELPGRKA